jgi:hypothetical protein
VPTNPRAAVLGLQNRSHRIPADPVADPGFQLNIARISRLFGNTDGVFVGRIQRRLRDHQTAPTQMFMQGVQQLSGALITVVPDYVIKRIQPFLLFFMPGALIGRVGAVVNALTLGVANCPMCILRRPAHPINPDH